MRIAAERDSISGDKIFLWKSVDREKAHEIVDTMADLAKDADEENLRLKISSIASNRTTTEGDTE